MFDARKRNENKELCGKPHFNDGDGWTTEKKMKTKKMSGNTVMMKSWKKEDHNDEILSKDVAHSTFELLLCDPYENCNFVWKKK